MSDVAEYGSAVSPLPLNSPVNIEPTIGGGLSSKIPSQVNLTTHQNYSIFFTSNDASTNKDDEYELEIFEESDEDGLQSQGHSIPRYCVTSTKISALATFTVDMVNVLTDMEECGNGGDSDVDGELCELLDEAARETELDKRMYMEEEELATFSDRNVLSVTESDAIDCNYKFGEYFPKIPPTWKPDQRKLGKNEPLFSSVDNPGKWNKFIFCPEFESNAKGGNYKGHFLATGTTSVPVSSTDGDREINGWKIYYDGWSKEQNDFRSGADKDNLFPSHRKGCLDANLLERLGLTKDRMVFGDTLFFH